MLQSLASLRKYTIRSADGLLGHPDDFYFDDRRWVVRHVLAATGRWRVGRRVLVPAAAARGVDTGRRRLRAELRPGWIAQAPAPDVDPPVSRQLEVELQERGAFTADWRPPLVLERSARKGRGDRHLRSAREVTGYRVYAVDGPIGHVADFLVETESWVIRYLVVATREWRPSAKRILLPPGWVGSVSWGDASIHVDLDRATIMGAPAYRGLRAIGRDDELRLFAYYGRPGRAQARAGAIRKDAVS